MNNVIEKENIKIENMIYEIRGVQVILDSDLAKLYECTNGTKDINKAVKRNIEKFPEDFYFQLTIEEALSLSRFQNGTLKTTRGHNIKYLPYVFTEQGVSMLATTLKTEIATRVSIKIMRTFVALRKFVSNDLIEQKYINNLVLKDSRRIDLIEETLSNFKEKNNHIFFEGQIYDAYSVMLDILNTFKNSIMIIDNYIDKNILDILSKTNKKYSKKLTSELGKGYSITSLKYMRQFYLFAKSQPLVDQSISWSHYTVLMTLDNQNEINYYIEQIAIYHWGKRTLQEKIKNKEYQRLSDEAKNKLINKEEFDIYDNIKNPILINTYNCSIDKENIEEKVYLKRYA